MEFWNNMDPFDKGTVLFIAAGILAYAGLFGGYWYFGVLDRLKLGE